MTGPTAHIGSSRVPENKCAMCGKDTMVREHHDRKKEKDHRREGNPTSATIVEQINGTYYTFDTANCVSL
jgi:hypothetical protein